MLQQIDESFSILNGKALPCAPGVSDRYQWLDEEAPYSILAHNTDPDPHFVYANRFALSCFGYDPQEMIGMPSRFTAAEKDRADRQKLFDTMSRHGIVYDYAGPRVDKSGVPFTIYDGIIWQLYRPDRSVWGQAALFWKDEHERPYWYTGMT